MLQRSSKQANERRGVHRVKVYVFLSEVYANNLNRIASDARCTGSGIVWKKVAGVCRRSSLPLQDQDSAKSKRKENAQEDPRCTPELIWRISKNKKGIAV